jgi:hypothetical protein
MPCNSRPRLDGFPGVALLISRVRWSNFAISNLTYQLVFQSARIADGYVVNVGIVV